MPASMYINSLPLGGQNASGLLMKSTEVAELVEARHDNVKRTIERCAERGVFVRPPMEDEPIADMLGRARTQKIYRLGKRESLIVVAQLCPEFTARIIDRWQELEAQLQQQTPVIPQTYAEALRLAADQAEQNQILQLENKQKTEENNALKSYFEPGLTPAQFVKGLNGVNSNKINDYLRSKGWLYKDKYSWRVFAHARDKYLTESFKRVEVDPVSRIELTVYKPVLLETGAIKIFEDYMKGKLPMKSDWNGKYYHSKVAA
ncbi:Rha family transcriptional regulator [Actinobacillus equuli subsp. equuli]|uniref:Rha family transcriptional regulator n=1 Tax=Actinobacillus equuli subsp. equuli TaxID=202947 RepID=A0A9X4G601_ACTEU|nr:MULTISPECIES: Rha family transcriptional regulator [Actinobacillus]MDE8035753.1 Rha family transcriptional regulator [Actinobacillus equuli subsp. equuli]